MPDIALDYEQRDEEMWNFRHLQQEGDEEAVSDG